MAAVEASIDIDASLERCFDVSQDYARRLEWDPFLSDIKFLDGASEPAVGVRTRVRSRRGMEMVSEYVAFDRPRVVAIKMVEGGPSATKLFSQFGGSWRFKANTDGTVRVTMRYTFELAGGWRRARWLIVPIIRRVFSRDVRARLDGLKRGVAAALTSPQSASSACQTRA